MPTDKPIPCRLAAKCLAVYLLDRMDFDQAHDIVRSMSTSEIIKKYTGYKTIGSFFMGYLGGEVSIPYQNSMAHDAEEFFRDLDRNRSKNVKAKPYTEVKVEITCQIPVAVVVKLLSLIRPGHQKHPIFVRWDTVVHAEYQVPITLTTWFDSIMNHTLDSNVTKVNLSKYTLTEAQVKQYGDELFSKHKSWFENRLRDRASQLAQFGPFSKQQFYSMLIGRVDRPNVSRNELSAMALREEFDPSPDHPLFLAGCYDSDLIYIRATTRIAQLQDQLFAGPEILKCQCGCQYNRWTGEVHQDTIQYHLNRMKGDVIDMGKISI